ncbi:MAG: potassium transporter TrkA [Geobacteraceae bacterium GWB2_52_12]|nr:MAG: potassium transporter TrkA [Geobacteraceae bacterium GWB2_52_12]
MYVVIVGAGEVGSHVARILVDEGHEVAVVELEERLARRLDSTLNALVVHGSGVSPVVLQRAGVEKADLLLAVTAVDEVNLIACMTARKYGGSGLRVVARVRQSQQVAGDLSLSAQDLGLDALISPEEAIANSTMEILHYGGTGEMREMAGGKLVLIGMALGADSPLVHETLAELRSDLPSESLVVAVHGHEGVRIPTGADRLQVDERAFILTTPQNLTELTILSGQPWYYVQRTLIVGCGDTGLALARKLESEKLTSTIIEKDQDRAELAAGLLPRSLVLLGDGSDPEFLRNRIEEGQIDAVVVLLEDPEKSVLLGIFAKSLGARKVIVRCDKPAYGQLASELGIDAVISPKRAMTDAILRYVRRGAVKSTLVLGEHDAEVIELRVPDRPAEPDLVEKALKDLSFPKGALIGAVIRNGKVFIPSGATVLRPGDDLLVVCRPEALRKIEELLA